MGSSSPDYTGAAIAQGEVNREVVRDQTFANRPNQYTPFGATTWNPYQTVDPATGEATTGWTQTQTLDPRLQEILDKQIAIQGGRSDVAGALTSRMANEFGTPMDWSGLSPMGNVPVAQFTRPEQLQKNISTQGLPGVDMKQTEGFDTSGMYQVGDPYQTRQSAEDAVYSQAMSRLTPQFESEQQQAEIKLRNQGLRPGDAAYDSQMAGLQQRQTDATNQAVWSANQSGRDESGQMFGQQMGLRDQQFGEAMGQADLYNQANQNMYNMQSGLRGQLFGERLNQGQFANQAAGQQFGMNQQANQQNFNQAMQQSGYANTLRQQQLTEAMQRRGFSLNEMNALLSGQQVGTPQMPNFMGAQAAQPAPIYQGAVDQGNFNSANNPWGAVLGAAGSLGGAYLGNPAAFGGGGK